MKPSKILIKSRGSRLETEFLILFGLGHFKGVCIVTSTKSNFNGMTLFNPYGERKYLSQQERVRFYDAIPMLECPQEQTFIELIFWTGCRPCEALGLTALQVDTGEDMIIIRSAKKRGKMKGRHFRPQPVPRDFIQRLAQVHDITRLQSGPERGANTRLWSMSRSTAWAKVKTVMDHAGLTGVRACARGLRHTYGTHAVLSGIPMPRLQHWMGHSSMETTACYLNFLEQEDRMLAGRMWPERAAS